MNNYYIKNIWGPGGQEGYPHKGKTEFAEGQKQAAQCFSECDGFFLYETGGKKNDKIGAKSIFARGTVQIPTEVVTSQDEQKYGKERGQEKNFPYYVKVNLNIKIDPLNGVPLDTIRAVLRSPGENMQRHGGLIKINKEQFDQLSIELNKKI